MSANEITSGRFTSLPVTIDAWLIDSCNEPHPPWVQLAFLNDAIDWDPAGGGLYIETREGYMYGAARSRTQHRLGGHRAAKEGQNNG